VDAVTAPVVRFGPDRRLTAAAGAGALVALVSALVYGDAAGRLLFAIATVLLAGYVAGDLIWSPRLTADAAGLRIRTPFTSADLRWADVDEVRADVRSRYGLRSATLEVDGGELLVVFSRRTLGTEPETAAGLVNAMRP
jgi:hypothetical protein